MFGHRCILMFERFNMDGTCGEGDRRTMHHMQNITCICVHMLHICKFAMCSERSSLYQWDSASYLLPSTSLYWTLNMLLYLEGGCVLDGLGGWIGGGFGVTERVVRRSALRCARCFTEHSTLNSVRTLMNMRSYLEYLPHKSHHSHTLGATYSILIDSQRRLNACNATDAAESIGSALHSQRTGMRFATRFVGVEHRISMHHPLARDELIRISCVWREGCVWSMR